MCGCKKHQTSMEPCTCICPQHRNFDLAYKLAMERYDEIVALKAQLDSTSDPDLGMVAEFAEALKSAEADAMALYSIRSDPATFLKVYRAEVARRRDLRDGIEGLMDSLDDGVITNEAERMGVYRALHKLYTEGSN